MAKEDTRHTLRGTWYGARAPAYGRRWIRHVPAKWFDTEAWRPLFNESAERADAILPGLAEILSRELDYLEANWPERLPVGICHADLFPDNVFFLGQSLSGLIDFYFACNDFLIYDLAICLNAWCFERDNSFNITKAKRMLSAYRKERDVSEWKLQFYPLLRAEPRFDFS